MAVAVHKKYRTTKLFNRLFEQLRERFVRLPVRIVDRCLKARVRMHSDHDPRLGPPHVLDKLRPGRIGAWTVTGMVVPPRLLVGSS